MSIAFAPALLVFGLFCAAGCATAIEDPSPQGAGLRPNNSAGSEHNVAGAGGVAPDGNGSGKGVSGSSANASGGTTASGGSSTAAGSSSGAAAGKGGAIGSGGIAGDISGGSAAGAAGSANCTKVTWFQDIDGDGYGSAARQLEQCSEPVGYAANSGDCNEYDPLTHPGAEELCDRLDNDCSASTADVCDVGCTPLTFTGHSYMFCSSPLSFDAASAQCAKQEMKLARINDASENEFLRTSSNIESWVGGNDSAVEGTFRWVDGTEFFSAGRVVGGNFTNWGTNEPNAAFVAEDCLEFLRNGNWNDCACSEQRRVLCERY
jgi:hypothetical protein